MSSTFVHEFAAMGTAVSIRLPAVGRRAGREATARAAAWFTSVESCCNRFDARSELRRLCDAPAGTAVAVSAMLLEAVRFALAVARETGGAFDPTVGARLVARGFDRDYQGGRRAPAGTPDAGATWRDVHSDPAAGAITLARPLLLDLGAVAKGLAVDLAARELAGHADFAIDAGGDLYLAGRNARGEPWSVGIRHPRDPERVIEALRISDAAVCTSGDYERRGAGGAPHIVTDAGLSEADALASVTVVAPTAVAADALGTAAFALGRVRGMAYLGENGVHGVAFSPSLERFATSDQPAGFRADAVAALA